MRFVALMMVMGSVAMATTLPEYRAQIDEIDDRLLKLLEERAQIVLKVGEIKKREGLPVLVPKREAEVIARLQRANARGALSADAVKRIWERMMEEMRGLEK